MKIMTQNTCLVLLAGLFAIGFMSQVLAQRVDDMGGASVETAMRKAASDPTLDTASQAFEAYVRDLETGDGEPLIEMMTNDCLWRTAGADERQRGGGFGRKSYASFAALRRDNLRVGVNVTLESVVRGDGDTVAFELSVREQVADRVKVNHHHAVFFEVRGKAICGLRVYSGRAE